MKNLGIGARLTIGFALVLTLMVLVAGLGIWRLQGAAHEVRQMQQQPIAKERLVSDWYRVTNRGVLRTIAIAKSADPALATYFKSDAVESAKVNDEIQKQLDVLVTGAEEKTVYEEISKRRKLFLSARDALMKDKSEGRLEESTKTFEDVFMPNAKAYLAAQESMLALQRKAIDSAAAGIERVSEQSRTLLSGLAGAALLLCTVYAWLLTRSITRPLHKAVRIAETVAAGDLTSDIMVDSSAETGKLLRALKAMNDSLKTTVAQVRTGTEAIAGASAEIASGNADLSRRTEQQAANLEETASSMEELTSTVKQNAVNARQANALAASASQVAVQGGAVVGEVVQTMSSINESSKKIADIIGVIDGIAFQTNILALNAAVEAARAGEQGRGFAVVASEVRTLAQRSASAAKEIKGLISESVGKVEDGTRLVDQAGKTMDEIVGAVKRVTDIIGEISAASDEQSSGIEQVNTAVAQMDQMTQQNAALVEEAAAAAESMREQAQGLGAAVSVFKLAPAVEAAAPVEAERRGPNRAKNVTRLPVKAKGKAEPKGEAASAGTAEPKKTGTDDDWSEF